MGENQSDPLAHELPRRIPTVMPYESSAPLLLSGLSLAALSLFLWLRTQSRVWLILALLAASGGLGAFIADRLVETDREHLEALFPKLAAAAERHDLGPIIAVLDPELHALRAEAERAIKKVRPTEVRITKLDVLVDSDASPPAATASLIVRIAGHNQVAGGPGIAIVGVRVELKKKAGRWLIRDATVEPLRAGAGQVRD